MDRVINVRDYPRGLPSDAVRISRPGRWGNPFHITDRSPRDVVIERYRTYAQARLRQEPDWLAPLQGKLLACYCAPLACHGDVLIELGA